MNFTFTTLQLSHFPLLVSWLNEPHVAQWWGEGKTWNLDTVTEKYSSNVAGYTLHMGTKKPIHSFIMCADSKPIGYIQYYAVADFPHENHTELPDIKNAAGIDLYIGDPDYIGRGFGPIIISQFLQEKIWPHFDACLADPHASNSGAIKAFTKAGFKIMKVVDHTAWMKISKKN